MQMSIPLKFVWQTRCTPCIGREVTDPVEARCACLCHFSVNHKQFPLLGWLRLPLWGVVSHLIWTRGEWVLRFCNMRQSTQGQSSASWNIILKRPGNCPLGWCRTYAGSLTGIMLPKHCLPWKCSMSSMRKREPGGCRSSLCLSLPSSELHTPPVFGLTLRLSAQCTCQIRSLFMRPRPRVWWVRSERVVLWTASLQPAH